MSRLIAENLRKSYRGRQVVRDVSLEVQAGEIVGLLGPNGAGKTTCFYMIAGLVRAEAGQIHIAGRDVSRSPMHSRAQLGLGYLAQEPSIFRRLSVNDNILAVLELRKDLPDSKRLERLDELLHDFGLGHLSESMAMSLSGGERRRLEIARSLAAEPGFILLDEPFAGVDPISVIDIQRIIQELSARGIGILITDHNVQETLRICERAYIISEGTVLADGKPQEILDHEQVRDVYLGRHFSL